MNVMFDTNVFNDIADGRIPVHSIPAAWTVFGTHVQRDEIENTKQTERRETLRSVFSRWVQIRIPTESAVWEVSAWDESKWTDEGEVLYTKLLEELNRIKRKKNNVQDALIAEAAIKNQLVLVTNDGALRKSAESFGAQTVDLRV